MENHQCGVWMAMHVCRSVGRRMVHVVDGVLHNAVVCHGGSIIGRGLILGFMFGDCERVSACLNCMLGVEWLLVFVEPAIAS